MIRSPPRISPLPLPALLPIKDHRHQAEQAQLLADGRGDEVALGDRHLVGPSTTQPGAEQPAGPEAEQRLDDLVAALVRSEEHTSELQSRQYLVCRLLLEKKK